MTGGYCRRSSKYMHFGGAPRRTQALRLHGAEPRERAGELHPAGVRRRHLGAYGVLHECQTFLKFEPYAPPYYQTDTTEEIMEPPAEHLTETMKRVTAHLMPLPMTMQMTMPGEASKSANTSTPSGSKTTSASPADDASMDVDGEEPKPAPEQPPTPPKPKEIDVYLEASKTPLDAAVYNSMRMMGEDRVIKYLNAILLVGGPANMPGLAHALEARLQSAAIAVMQSNEVRTQVIPPPKDVDPSVLVWKGAAVLGKMEGVSELWVTPADWDLLGMRGLKERCFYL
ncbi:hypothetical protein BD626DRAFT_220580 [Schizophyllum amplum]|uniref:Uncharacterized protein n=1 Tax=Schizophyllum amplum TaxID=97359 RepID=A0A550CLB8_9AGAR|nr:hypothetical protein BD626DRAFT_220580 [Auriculariopsis ampla]